tara:strand:- start:307 stop:750 length:444 start_codon:yes stop_codon:yes gene_type:complete
MDFESILKIVNAKKEKKGEICMICYFPIISKNDNLSLSCSHHYHKSCLKSNRIFITCPYCLKVTKKNIKKNKKKKVEKHIDVICKAILKSGKNKGKKCNRKNCKIHKNFKNESLCQAIIKTGKNKGKKCNRKNCKYHNNSIDKEIIV